MNENILERWGRSKKPLQEVKQEVQLWVQPQQLNTKIRQYFTDAAKSVDGGAWLDRPETPTSAELLDTDTASSGSSDIVEIVPNKPRGAWESQGKLSSLRATSRALRVDFGTQTRTLQLNTSSCARMLSSLCVMRSARCVSLPQGLKTRTR